MILKQATLWQRAAIDLIEQTLDELKSKLSAGSVEPAVLLEIQSYTRELKRLQQLQDSALMCEFESWRHDHPELTCMMVRAVAKADRSLLNKLWHQLEEALSSEVSK
jgi:hypothetical protein